MITTSEIAPELALAPFVRCYSFREVDTQGLNLIKPWHASHEITMTFSFKAKPLQFFNHQTGMISKEGRYGGVIGVGTHYNGESMFKGCYSFFEISFKPNGFNKIFRLPASEITDQILDVEDLFDTTIKRFFDQLCSAKGIFEMGVIANAYLLAYLQKQKYIVHKDGITSISKLILQHGGGLTIDRLADIANMSVRNLERQFMEQVGISPKLYCCITRFNQALALKLKNPERDWTSIAFQCGYFDQMHLIKDFKKFAGHNPASFLKQTPLSIENFTSRIEA